MTAKIEFVAKAIREACPGGDIGPWSEVLAKRLIAGLEAIEAFDGLTSSDDEYFTAADLLDRFSIAAITFYRWERNSGLNFPKPMLINRRKFFRKSDIYAWEKARNFDKAVRSITQAVR